MEVSTVSGVVIDSGMSVVIFRVGVFFMSVVLVSVTLIVVGGRQCETPRARQQGVRRGL